MTPDSQKMGVEMEDRRFATSFAMPHTSENKMQNISQNTIMKSNMSGT